MDKGIAPLEIKNEVTDYDKEILSIALDGIYGWKFNPVAVITNGMEDYYFICKVKTMIETIQMKMAKIYVQIQKNKKPRLLAIEEIC
ncbi:hypothetical protein AB2T96_10450 [Clostridium butyricum]|jgi:hypothetical protein|uniref:Uncharacterized protein n=2 Tax=Clostridium butyricum TaxID=1492 RepID=C4IFJ3_CLOBU|nr:MULTISPECIES: hypothetical protein [Clostridium]ETI88587.1 MAG: hypothetical protein Q607_CBUC00196G0021 [Clostridium butyricum DORA_1]EDT74165.1 hypothetical protein CBY_3728 [Clostridium butyricum 5521]EDT76428.1 hypothetical protein CBY_0646 [Clostridium butyricum 5521]EEP54250.1 conserved hypothetical protein [Clostridium butyricum E4 str. BoNT E BL5262]ENZ34155.1 hypothetical protein HMPREF1084_01444 [Clostridium butyricum 60E.3]